MIIKVLGFSTDKQAVCLSKPSFFGILKSSLVKIKKKEGKTIKKQIRYCKDTEPIFPLQKWLCNSE